MLVIVHAPTARVAAHVPGGVPLATYPGGTASVAVHCVSAAEPKPTTVNVAGVPPSSSSEASSGEVATDPAVHSNDIDTARSVSGTKSLCTTNDASI